MKTKDWFVFGFLSLVACGLIGIIIWAHPVFGITPEVVWISKQIPLFLILVALGYVIWKRKITR
jgi:hypothetical protein